MNNPIDDVFNWGAIVGKTIKQVTVEGIRIEIIFTDDSFAYIRVEPIGHGLYSPMIINGSK